MQVLDLPRQILQVAVVVDNIVGRSESLLAAQLRVDYARHGFRTGPIPDASAFDLQLTGHVNHQHTVYQRPLARLQQQRNGEHAIGCLQSLRAGFHEQADPRVHYTFHSTPQARILEHPLPHPCPVEPAFRGQDIRSEQRHEFAEGGLSGFHYFPGDAVCVQHWDPEPGEQALHGAFAAADPPREAYTKSGAHLGSDP